MTETQQQAQPYDRQPEETEQAYQAFAIYRDMDPSQRSIDKAFDIDCQQKGKVKKGKQAYGHWTRWSSVHKWVARCRAYDAEAQKQARKQAQEERQAEIKKWLDEQFTISKAFQSYVRREIRNELERPDTRAIHEMRQLALVFDISGSWTKDILGVGDEEGT